MRLPHALPSPERRDRRFARRLPRLLLLVFGFILFLVAGAVSRAALFGGDGVDATEELALLRVEASPLLVYSEFGQYADTVWAADPADPSRRGYVATIEHTAGYGISASLSPDGSMLAFAVLPPSASPTDAAALWALDVGTTNATKLADKVDPLTDPIWSPAGDAIAVRRPVGVDSTEVVLVDLAGNATTLTSALETPYPISFTAGAEALYIATLTAAGTELVSVPLDGSPVTTLANLSDGFARDWSLSPDGSQIAYLAQTSRRSFSYATELYDVATGETSGAIASATGSQFNPVWRPDGGLTIGNAPSTAAAGAMTHVPPAGVGDVAASLPGPDVGFDVPLSWSPEGGYLVVRNFEGDSPSNPGPSHVVIIDSAGGRLRLSGQSDILVIGWLD